MDFITRTLYYVIRCPGKYTRDIYVKGKKKRVKNPGPSNYTTSQFAPLATHTQ